MPYNNYQEVITFLNKMGIPFEETIEDLIHPEYEKLNLTCIVQISPKEDTIVDGSSNQWLEFWFSHDKLVKVVLEEM